MATEQILAKQFIENISNDCIYQVVEILDKKKPQVLNPQQEIINDQNVLLDFSNFFKKKPRNKKKPVMKRFQKPKDENDKENNEDGQNLMPDEDDPEREDEKNVIVVQEQIIQNEVPRNLTITQEEMKQRRFLDQRRWFSMSRCQYKRSCGISSLVSVWNYLFSTLGTGDLPPISQEDALIQLGVCKEKDRYFGDIEFGSFTGNQTLIKWFKLLCKIYKKEGRAFIMWKHSGQGKTPGVDEEVALQKLTDGLKSENNGFIYHAHDHYFCPVGFELTTQRPMDAYKKIEDINPSEIEPWIFIGEISKCYPCFHIKKWKEVVKDITMGNPNYYNIRRPDKGVRERKGKAFQPGGSKYGTTINCIMQFQKVIKREPKVIPRKQVPTVNPEEVSKGSPINSQISLNNSEQNTANVSTNLVETEQQQQQQQQTQQQQQVSE